MSHLLYHMRSRVKGKSEAGGSFDACDEDTAPRPMARAHYTFIITSPRPTLPRGFPSPREHGSHTGQRTNGVARCSDHLRRKGIMVAQPLRVVPCALCCVPRAAIDAHRVIDPCHLIDAHHAIDACLVA